MWLKQCHKPSMTGNGKFIPPIKMVIWAMAMALFYPHSSKKNIDNRLFII